MTNQGFRAASIAMDQDQRMEPVMSSSGTYRVVRRLVTLLTVAAEARQGPATGLRLTPPLSNIAYRPWAASCARPVLAPNKRRATWRGARPVYKVFKLVLAASS